MTTVYSILAIAISVALTGCYGSTSTEPVTGNINASMDNTLDANASPTDSRDGNGLVEATADLPSETDDSPQADAVTGSQVVAADGAAVDTITGDQMVAADDAAVDTDNINTNLSINTLPEPLGLKGVVYTDTEIEIFWNRSEEPTVVQYRILRDGIVLDSRDALSYYDNTVVAGTTYDYSVESVDANGVFSVPVNVFLTTPELTPTINLVNAESILSHVIEASNGALFGEALTQANTMSRISDELEVTSNGFTKLSSETTDMGQSYNNIYDCDVSGQYTVRATSNVLPSYFGILTDCVSNLFPDRTLNGGVSAERFLSKYVYNSGGGATLNLEDFSSTDASNDTQVLDGEFRYFNGSLNSWSFSERSRLLPDENGQFSADSTRSIEPFTVYSPAFEGSTQLSITSIVRRKGVRRTADSNNFEHTLTAQFSIQSPTTGNKPISVSTPVEFYTDQNGGCFFTGQFKLTAEDGSELLLNADNGTANSALMTVTSDGTITEQTLLWSGSLAAILATPLDVSNYTPDECY